MGSTKSRSRSVREPIQVYLDRSEREDLDRLATKLGVSRAEILRRGIRALAVADARSVYDAMDRVIGMEFPGAPVDLADRHDDYLKDE